MNIRLLITCLLTFTMFVGFSQNNALELKYKKNNKIKLIREGTRLKITDKDGELHRGRYSIEIDSADNLATFILIGSDSLKINEIAKIKSQPLFPKIGGGLMCGAGVFLVFTGINFIASDPDVFLVQVAGGLVTLVGVASNVGGIFFSTIGKSYKTEKWEYSIVKE